jgi:hypothetical protein
VVASLFDRIADYESVSGAEPHGPNRSGWGSSVDAEEEKERETDSSDENNFAHREALRGNRFCEEKHISAG